MKVKQHFDSVAAGYDKERGRGILGKIVDKEREVILELLDVHEGEEILDAGCGSGYYSLLIAGKKAHAFGVDISEKMIECLKMRGVKGVVGNLESFNLGKKFDKVLCCGALEFISHPEIAIGNFAKHTKKDGFLVMLYPRKSFGGLLYFLYHLLLHGIKIRLFSKRMMKKMLEKQGFKIIEFQKPDFITLAVKALFFFAKKKPALKKKAE